jgi:hypothetical protein
LKELAILGRSPNFCAPKNSGDAIPEKSSFKKDFTRDSSKKFLRGSRPRDEVLGEVKGTENSKKSIFPKHHQMS